MKEHIDTIPLWEAFREDCECPLCRLHSLNEANYREYFMGASVMEPDVRVETNKKGFCARHYGQMFRMSNRLGLALSTHTYLRDVIARIDADAKSRDGAPKKTGLFARKQAAPAADELSSVGETCILCERLKTTMQRYIETFFVTWKKEAEFKKAFSGCKGFCVQHYAALMQAAPANLSGADLAAFTKDLIDVEKKALDRIEKELEWFTLKFDYRNADKPWGTSEDAVERTLNKLRMLSIPFPDHEPEARPK
ncbi:MAG: DUF6062 family protein [Eubacteriales bacterium]|nr:DUF6062 family protein [Eubacteriales bacterium]